MIKLTVLYGHSVDVAAFEAYYSSTHMSLVGKINGIVKAETTKIPYRTRRKKPSVLPDGGVVLNSPLPFALTT